MKSRGKHNGHAQILPGGKLEALPSLLGATLIRNFEAWPFGPIL
jgi:hypothetical protein